jgi:glycosyltransferase involved in cell wall biosynthesis
MQLKNTNPLLSISCLTFNHVFFIKKCLDSFLMQKTTFPIEVIIHDDCSNDGTREIIEEYSRKYPDIIFPIFQTENQYSRGVRGFMARFNFPRCRGKYIALCEGDDYWTDPYKLQKQVDFLESNTDYSLCFHDAVYSYTDTTKKKFSEKYPFLNEKNDFTRQDLLERQWFIPTASMLFRNFGKVPDFFFKINAGDYNLQLYLSKTGKFHYISDTMSVYRITGKGLGTANQNPHVRINDLKIWINLVDGGDKKYILRWTLANYRLLLKNDFQNSKYYHFQQYFFILVKTFLLYQYYLIIHFINKKMFKNT